jgi:hypothetical protein
VSIPVETRPLDVFRDDGPLAHALSRAVPAARRVDPAALLAIGALPLLVVLVWPAHALPLGFAAAAVAWLVLVGGLGAGRSAGPRFAWTLPPMLRALEYGTLIKLTAIADPGAMPACYALLAVLAFHHYDAVYRLRHQRVAPPAWTRVAGGGWDGRLALAAVLALAGVLGPALVAAAIALGVAFVAESITSWLRYVGAERPAAVYEQDELEDA